MELWPYIVSFICGFAVAILVVYIVTRHLRDKTEQVLLTQENCPELKVISEFRQTIANLVITTICGVWGFIPDNTTIEVQEIGFNQNVIYMAHDDLVFRIYCNWERNRIRVEFAYTPYTKPAIRITRQAKFSVNGDQLDCGRIEAINYEWRHEFLKSLYGNEDECYQKCISAAKAVADTAKEEELLHMLFTSWNNYVIHHNKQDFENDTQNFTRLLAFILHFYPNAFNDFLRQERELIKGEDK